MQDSSGACRYAGCKKKEKPLESKWDGENTSRNPNISLLIVDPENTSRFIQIRGQAELTQEGALTHLDEITRKYTSHPQYYGYVFPFEKRKHETRVICRIHAASVTLDAVHS